MAAVARMVLIFAGIWTALSFVLAVAVGRALARLQPASAPLKAPAYRVVDLRRPR
jgi:hypothetical protein